jgi:hypothetical protein
MRPISASAADRRSRRRGEKPAQGSPPDTRGLTTVCRLAELAIPKGVTPQGSRLFSDMTMAHPASIPQKMPGSSRRSPAIPASQLTHSPALAANPRTVPANPKPARPACHAGGRGFESRRSRRNTCKSASFLTTRPPAIRASRTDPARGSTANPRPEPVVAPNPRKKDDRPARSEVDQSQIEKRSVCR